MPNTLNTSYLTELKSILQFNRQSNVLACPYGVPLAVTMATSCRFKNAWARDLTVMDDENRFFIQNTNVDGYARVNTVEVMWRGVPPRFSPYHPKNFIFVVTPFQGVGNNLSGILHQSSRARFRLATLEAGDWETIWQRETDLGFCNPWWDMFLQDVPNALMYGTEEWARSVRVEGGVVNGAVANLPPGSFADRGQAFRRTTFRYGNRNSFITYPGVEPVLKAVRGELSLVFEEWAARLGNTGHLFSQCRMLNTPSASNVRCDPVKLEKFVSPLGTGLPDARQLTARLLRAITSALGFGPTGQSNGLWPVPVSPQETVALLNAVEDYFSRYLRKFARWFIDGLNDVSSQLLIVGLGASGPVPSMTRLRPQPGPMANGRVSTIDVPMTWIEGARPFVGRTLLPLD